MTKLYFDGWAWRCENCDKMLFLPGIVPNIESMKNAKWRFCPCCGKKIDFKTTEAEWMNGKAEAEWMNGKE